MTCFAETMLGSLRFHAHSSDPSVDVSELVKLGVYEHAKQNNLNLSNWSTDLIEVSYFEPDKCYRDHQIIVDEEHRNQFSSLVRRLDDLWNGACNSPCDRNNLSKADNDELLRFGRAVCRSFQATGHVDIRAAGSIDLLARILYARGVRA